MRVFADAGKNVEHFAAQRGGVLDAVGREQWKTMVLGQVDQPAIDALLAPHEMALQLNINAVAAKDLEQPLHTVVITLGSTGRWPVVRCGSRRTSRGMRRCHHLAPRVALRANCVRRATGRDRPAAYAPRSLKRCRSRKERDQSIGKFFQLHVGQKTRAFFAPQMRLSQEGAKICIADSIFHQHGQESAIRHR